MEQVMCKCGRIAEVESRGKNLCWEGYLPDEPTKWKARYPDDQECRHEIERDEQ